MKDLKSYFSGVSESGRTVILSRTNLSLFEQLVENVCKKNDHKFVGLDIQMANYFKQVQNWSVRYFNE
jgi:hypothetical protein